MEQPDENCALAIMVLVGSDAFHEQGFSQPTVIYRGE
jgi:hypothetical protein